MLVEKNTHLSQELEECETQLRAVVAKLEESQEASATNSEVESAMNHRRRRAVLRNNIFSEEAFNAFKSGDAYIRAAQDGLARATDQYAKDIRVRKFDKHVY